MYKWGVIRSQAKREHDRIRKQMMRELKLQVNRIIKHPDTIQKSVEDWPDIHQFIDNTFPNADISSIPIYETTPGVMKRNGFDECGGCYIDELQLILVKDRITSHSPGKGKFSRKMNEAAASEMATEDVVVHELLHAVSHRVRGMGSARMKWYESVGGGIKYRMAEEEFVYTNCMPYYRSKGMTDQEVIDSIFLPFCISDVMSDRSYMLKLFASLDVEIPDRDTCGPKEFRSKIRRIMNSCADDIVPLVVQEAKDRAAKMIDLYQKYGKSILHSNTNPVDDPGQRVNMFDLDDDF